MKKLLLSLVATLLLIPGLLHAAPILYSISPDDNVVRAVDQTTGAEISGVAMSLSSGGTVSRGFGLAVDSTSGLLYALLNTSTGGGRRLATLNPLTGVATEIGALGDSFSGIAFDSAGTLFGVTGDGAGTPETLFTISTANAATTFFQSLGNGNDGETIAYNPDDGLMYHASGFSGGEILETINLTSGAITDIPVTGYVEALGMTYRGGGSFFLSDLNNVLYTVSTAGAVNAIGSLTNSGGGTYRAKGLALVGTAIPEPTTLFLMLTGLVGFIGARRITA